MSAQQILDTVKQQYGITFTEVHTGGGCMALEARLESGHWIVATDESLCGFRERIRFESYEDNYNTHCGEDPRALGWFIGIYENGTADDGSDWWGGGQETVVDVRDYDAFADQLPAMVGAALKALTGV